MTRGNCGAEAPVANSLAAHCAGLRARGRKALVPYVTAGFPTLPQSVALARAVADAGADVVEIGFPFSDPIADGPTIQATSHAALERGVMLCDVLQAFDRAWPADGPPLVLMTYLNPLLAGGFAGTLWAVRDAGFRGLIVPDLSLDGEWEESQAHRDVRRPAVVRLAAPTTPPARLKKLGASTEGFLYLVALTGVTGARRSLPADLGAFARRARRATTAPLYVGFGIAGPESARAAAACTDGVIVGSALLDRVRAARSAKAALRSASGFVRSLRRALDSA